MTDAPQAPYDDEGDARPVSLIGAKISSVREGGTPAEGAGGFGAPGSPGEGDERRGSAGSPAPGTGRRNAPRRGRRRRGDRPESPDPGLTDTEAFLLGGAGEDKTEQGDATPGDEDGDGTGTGWEAGPDGDEGTDPTGGSATRAEPGAPVAVAANGPVGAGTEAGRHHAAGTPGPLAAPDPDAGTTAGGGITAEGGSGADGSGAGAELSSTRSDGSAAAGAERPGTPAPPVGPGSAPPADGPAGPVPREHPYRPARRDLGPTTFPRAPVPRPPVPRPPTERPPGERSVGERSFGEHGAAGRPESEPSRAPERSEQRPATGPAAPEPAPAEEPPTPDGPPAVELDELPPFGPPLGSADPPRSRRPRDAGRPAAVAPRPPLMPAAPASDPTPARAELDRRASSPWPWQEPFATGGDLEPWEEIPIREPLADRAAALLGGSRRIAVVSIAPGVGRTTVTAAAGLELAGARREAVVAVDPAAEPSPDQPAWSAPLASRIGVAPTGNARVLVAARADLSSFGDVRRLVGGSTGAVGGDWSGDDGTGGGWPESGSYGEGLDVLPVRGLERDGLAPLDLRDLNGALTDLDSWYPLVLVDCPPGLDDAVTSTVLTGTDAIVLVARATPADLHEAADAVAALSSRVNTSPGAGRPGPGVVVAVTSPRSGRWSPRTRAAASALAGHVSGLVRIPYDPALTGYGTIRGPRSRRRTRKSFLRLAVMIVETCATADTRPPAAVAGAVRREIG